MRSLCWLAARLCDRGCSLRLLGPDLSRLTDTVPDLQLIMGFPVGGTYRGQCSVVPLYTEIGLGLLKARIALSLPA